jgi:hypothetical protein
VAPGPGDDAAAFHAAFADAPPRSTSGAARKRWAALRSARADEDNAGPIRPADFDPPIRCLTSPPARASSIEWVRIAIVPPRRSDPQPRQRSLYRFDSYRISPDFPNRKVS